MFCEFFLHQRELKNKNNHLMKSCACIKFLHRSTTVKKNYHIAVVEVANELVRRPPLRPPCHSPLLTTFLPQPFPLRVLPVPASPLSPGNNRNRFMANSQPLQVSCDLSSVGLHNYSMRFSFTAVVLIIRRGTLCRVHLQLNVSFIPAF